MIHRLIFIGALLSAQSAFSTTLLLSKQQQKNVYQNHQVKTQLETIQSLNSASELSDLIENMNKSSRFTLLEKQHLTFQSILKLNQLPLSDKAVKLLINMTQKKDNTFESIEHHGRTIATPLWPVSHAAQKVLNNWDRTQKLNALSDAMVSGDLDQVQKLRLELNDKYIVNIIRADEFQAEANNKLALIESFSDHPIIQSWLALSARQELILSESLNKLNANHQLNAELIKSIPLYFDEQQALSLLKNALSNPQLFTLASQQLKTLETPQKYFDTLYPYFANKILGGTASFEVSKVLTDEIIFQLAQRYPHASTLERARILSCLSSSHLNGAKVLLNQLKQEEK